MSLPLWKKASIALTILYLLPIWLLQYLPLNDLPNHLASVHLLIQHYQGKCDFIIPNGNLLVPNLSSFHFMVFIGQFIGADAAARVLLSLYALLLPASLAYFLKAIKPELEPYSLAAFAVMYNWFFLMGFLNFTISIPLFLFAFGFYLKTRNEKFDIANAIFIAIIGLLLYFTHLAAFGAFAIAMAALWLMGKREKPIMEAFALVPGILVFASYLLLSPPSMDGSQIVYGSMVKKLSYLIGGFPNPALWLFFALLAITHYLMNYRKTELPELSSTGGQLLFIGIIFLAASFFIPENLPNWQFASPRALPFAFALAFPFLASWAHNNSQFSKELLAGFALFSVILLAASLVSLLPLSSDVGAIASLSSKMEQGSYAFSFGSGFTDSNIMFTEPLLHSWGYWTMQKGIFSPYLFSYGYSPLSYSSRNLRGSDDIGRWMDELAYETFTYAGNDTCKAWRNYHSKINWSMISQNYDYVVFRAGKCDGGVIVPGTYALIANESGNLVYGKAN